MDAGTLSLNIAYVFYVGSSLFRSPVKLRAALVATSAVFIVYGLIATIWSVVWWNLAFGLSHALQLGRTVRDQRRVQLSDSEELLRDQLFPGLDRLEFFTLWSLGVERELADGQSICREGEPQGTVAVILAGEVVVHQGGRTVTTMGQGRLVGERTFVSGGVANADVGAQGAVRIREWDQEKLAALSSLNPAAAAAFRDLIGRDLAAKLTGRVTRSE